MTPRKRYIALGGLVGVVLMAIAGFFVLSTRTNAPAVQYLECEIAEIDVEWQGDEVAGDFKPGETITLEIIPHQGRWIQHALNGSRSVEASWLPDRIVAKSGETSIDRSDLSLSSELRDVMGKLTPVDVAGQCQVTEAPQTNII